MNKLKNINENLYIPVMLVITGITGVFYIVNYPRRQFAVVMLLMALVIFSAFYIVKQGGDKVSAIIFASLLVSALIKADYVIYTPSYVRQHDVIGFGAGFGQAAFIEYFYEKIRLIDFDPRTRWGFFQPPLHHMIAGIWLKIMDFVCPNYGWACDNVQLLTLIYSMLIPFVSLKIFKKIGLHNYGLTLAMIFVCAHPIFILLSGSINNDVLCILLQLLTMYYFLSWNTEISKLIEGREDYGRTRALVYIILSALSMGLSMMAKLSGILIAPAIGVIMLMRLLELCKPSTSNKDRQIVISQYALFAIISIPIGIWSPLRNLYLFGVPLNYTPEVGEPLTGHSLLARIFDVKTTTPFTNLIDSGSSFDEYNFFLGMIKTSLVGEYTFSQIRFATLIGWGLFITGSLLFVVILICAIESFKNKEIDLYVKTFLAVYSVCTMIFYVNLCFSIPNFSSLDFRYIAHMIIIGGIYLGFYVNQIDFKQTLNYVNQSHADSDKVNADRGSSIKLRYVNRIILALTLLFAFFSIALYLLVGTVSWR